jgi:hypothetical protein
VAFLSTAGTTDVPLIRWRIMVSTGLLARSRPSDLPLPRALRPSANLFVCAIALAAVASCGGDDSEPPPQATRAQQLFDEPSTCGASFLDGSGACRGPWAYQVYATPCYNEGRDPLCGQEPEPYNLTCLHAELGLSASTSASVDCVSCAKSLLISKCNIVAANFRGTVKGDRTIVIDAHAVTQYSRIDPNGWSGECGVTLTNAGIGPDAACGTGTRMRDKLCRLARFGEAPKGTCGTAPALLASASGKSRAQLALELPYLDPATPQCSTLEGSPVGAQRFADAVARLSSTHPFWTALPAPTADEDAARGELAKQAKLMFELGITSPAVNLDEVRALYANVDQEVSCGVAARPPVTPACQSWGTTNGVNAALGLCQRMLSSHVAPAVFTGELDRCLDVLGNPAFADSSACGLEYRGVAEELEEKLLTKALGDLNVVAGGTTLTGLDATLRRIDRWYTGAALALTSTPEALSDATARVLRAFWDRAYQGGGAAVAFPGGDAGSSAAAAQLATLSGSRLETDRQILAAAFASPAPLDEVPLLLLTADTLTPLYERLRAAAPLYDFACRIIATCGESDANEATRLLRLIGAIGNDVALGQALAASASVRAPWLNTFTALRASRPALERAYRKATGRPDASLDELYSENVVPAAASLKEAVFNASAMWTSYQGHGVLLPRDGTQLRASMSEAARAGTVSLFSQSKADLTANREGYQRTRGDVANIILSRINNQQYQDRLNSERALMGRDYDDLGEDLSGLMHSQDQAEQQIGRFLAIYNERAKAGWVDNYQVSGEPHTIAVSAAQARGNGEPVTVVSQIATLAVRDPQDSAQPWHLDVAKGDMLSVAVTGAWAPTCALRSTPVIGPTGPRSVIDPTNALTGPEGYTFTWETNAFRAHEYSSSDFATQSSTTSLCANAKAGLENPIYGGGSVSGSYCRSWQTGHTETTTDSTGTRLSYGAHFAGGMRIPGTPLAQLPGGSLLLVEVETRADGDHIRDVRVVRPQSTFVFRGAGKAYLLVNDKAGCTLNPSELAVTYVHAKPAAVASQSLVEAMATVLTNLQTQKRAYLDQGSITPSELSALHNSAYDQLRAACNGCNLSAYPEPVRGMFDAWLSAELAAIERQTRIAAAERALDRLVLRVVALESDLAGAANGSRLLSLMTTWQLGNLAFHQLREKSDLVLEIGTDYMLPLLHVRYPQGLTLLRTSSATELSNLRQIDWTLPFDEQLVRLEAVASAVATRVAQATLIGGQASAPLIVAFPKPVAVGGTPRPAITGAVVAAPERLTGVWEPCGADWCLKANPVFTIEPSDVYGQLSVGLGCGEAAPIVRSLAVFAANSGASGNASWNATPRRFDNVRAADISFPTEAGVRGYRIGGPLTALTSARVRTLAGTSTEAWTSFNTYARADRDFDGTSPFGSFAVNVGSMATSATAPFASAHTMVVVIDVETRAATSALSGVAPCGATL